MNRCQEVSSRVAMPALIAVTIFGCSEQTPRPASPDAERGAMAERVTQEVAVTGGVIRGTVGQGGIFMRRASPSRSPAEGSSMRGASPSRSPAEGSAPAVLRQYHGIPYAAAPVGVLRWAPTAPVTPWEGVLDAREPGPICIQRTRVGVPFYDPPPDAELPEQSEDCLTLNVWTEAERQDERRPVMVWIHGGGLQAGSGSEQSGRLLAGHGAVVVTFNYRLGRLGFLAHPELTAENPDGVSGNQGFRDQVQALEWVRDNIARFGGDPGNVTIFGESAGAYSVSVMQASPRARGLFHRAIGQSGGGFQPMSHRTEDRTYAPSAEKLGLRFAAAVLGEREDRSLAALREVPAAAILATAESSPLFNTYEFLPTVDGDVLTADVGATFAAGRQADVPTMVGSTDDEGDALIAHFVRFMGAGQAGFATFAGAMLPEVTDEIEAHYAPATDAEAMRSWTHLFTDLTFTYPMRAWARSMEPLDSDAWLYWFTWHPPITEADTYGAFHGATQSYLFDGLARFRAVPTDADRELARTMAETWVRFAATGNPNGGELPEWPAFTAENEAYLELGATIRTGDHLRIPDIALIERAWAERRRANALGPRPDA